MSIGPSQAGPLEHSSCCSRYDLQVRTHLWWKLIALFAAIVALIAAVASAFGASPIQGPYVGTTSTNAPGNVPPRFSMTITKGKCAAPGRTARRIGYCATVKSLSLIQAPCPSEEFVDDAFFPVTEPVRLSRSLTISHTYTLYSNGGQLEDKPITGGHAVGTFQYSLAVTAHGSASGTLHLAFGNCDSGALSFSAMHKS
jgi:hypothetical protein